MGKTAVLAAALLAWAGGAFGAAGLTLTSPDVAPQSKIATEQLGNCNGVGGKNISPALAWSDVPKNTKSFALTLYDPDAPTGSGLWHWVVIDIPADATSLAKGAGDLKSGTAPKGVIQPKTDIMPGYMGPCPPPGSLHHYLFTLYALDADKVDADANTSPALIGFFLHYHALAKATLTATYSH
jgi:Raf kinase inhibitor-like YbhB/YbcL family protein